MQFCFASVHDPPRGNEGKALPGCRMDAAVELAPLDGHVPFVYVDLNTTDFGVIPQKDMGFPRIQEG